MLNDLARPARLLVAAFGAAVGVMVSGVVAGAATGAASAALVVGLVLELAVLIGFAVPAARTEQRLRQDVVEGTGEIASGAVDPVPALGRVVRRRVVDLPSWSPGRGTVAGRSGLTVLTAVGDGEPRRVAALVPVALGVVSAGVPAVLLLHPTRREVAVLDDRVTAAGLAAVDGDPRWRTERLPTDRSVVGGVVAMLVASFVGTAAGAGLGALVVTLAT